jgi:hypothetical protein
LGKLNNLLHICASLLAPPNLVSQDHTAHVVQNRIVGLQRDRELDRFECAGEITVKCEKAPKMSVKVRLKGKALCQMRQHLALPLNRWDVLNELSEAALRGSFSSEQLNVVAIDENPSREL